MWYWRLHPFYRWENQETVSVASLQEKKKKKASPLQRSPACTADASIGGSFIVEAAAVSLTSDIFTS